MKKFLIAAIALTSLAACGKMGNLEYPPGAVYPRQYPAPQFPKSPEKAPALTENHSTEDKKTPENTQNDQKPKDDKNDAHLLQK